MENKSGQSCMHSSATQNSLSDNFSAIVRGRDVLAAGSRGKNIALLSPTWRQGAILKIWLQGEMVRVIKLSMKCTLVRALRGMRGRKKPKVSVEGGQGSSPRWFGQTQVRLAGVALTKPSRAAHTCCLLSQSCCPNGAGDGGQRKQWLTGKDLEGKKPPCSPVNLKL